MNQGEIMENKDIGILDVRKLINILSDELGKLDDNGVVKIHEDLYWNILDEELYEPYHDPAKLTMGSLAEDWEFLQKVREGEREMIDYDLYKLASILKFLGKHNIIMKNKTQ